MTREERQAVAFLVGERSVQRLMLGLLERNQLDPAAVHALPLEIWEDRDLLQELTRILALIQPAFIPDELFSSDRIASVSRTARRKRKRKSHPVARERKAPRKSKEWDALEAYFAELVRYKPLRSGMDPQEVKNEREIFRQFRTSQDPAERERLRAKIIEGCQRFVVSVARGYSGRLTLLEYIQAGNMGLLEAVERYDPERGYRFISYANYWVRQAILRLIAEEGFTARIPLNKMDKTSAYQKAVAQFQQQHQRMPERREIAAILGVAETNIAALQDFLKFRSPSSLQQPLGDDGDLLGDLIADKKAAVPSASTQRSRLRQMVEAVFDKMPEKREVEVLQYWLGFKTGKEETLDAIANLLSIEIGKPPLTRERIRQIKKKGKSRFLAKWSRMYPGVRLADFNL